MARRRLGIKATAEAVGCSARSLRRWIKRDPPCPHEAELDDGGNVVLLTFVPAEVVAWREVNVGQAVAERPKKKAGKKKAGKKKARSPARPSSTPAPGASLPPDVPTDAAGLLEAGELALARSLAGLLQRLESGETKTSPSALQSLARAVESLRSAARIADQDTVREAAQAEVRRKEAVVARLEHELEVLRERWIERDQAEAEFAAEVARARDALLGGLPERLAGQSAEVIRAELGRVLEGLARGAEVAA